MTLINVGTAGNASYYGTFDQNGNVAEWIESSNSSNTSAKYIGGDFSNSVADNFYTLNHAGVVSSASSRYSTVGFRIASLNDIPPLGPTNLVVVADPGNSANDNGLGSVSYTYQISKYEVTVDEYVEFLNAVAKTDTYGLYNSNMPISRQGTSGNYSYYPKTIKINNDLFSTVGNLPITWVSYFDAIRYVNWLQNNKPTGTQNTSTTEDGSYTINGFYSVQRKNNESVQIVLPNINEWYKAAYYKGNGTNSGYYKFATQFDTLPVSVAAADNVSGERCVPGLVFEACLSNLNRGLSRVICSNDGQKVVTCGLDSYYVKSYSSTDYGKNWNISTVYHEPMNNISTVDLVSSAAADILFISRVTSGDTQLYRSIDSGQTWEQCLSIMNYITSFYPVYSTNTLSVSEDGTIVALLIRQNTLQGTISKILISTDSGATWSLKNAPNNEVLMVNITNNNRFGNNAIVIFGRTNTSGISTLYVSVDNGDTYFPYLQISNPEPYIYYTSTNNSNKFLINNNNIYLIFNCFHTTNFSYSVTKKITIDKNNINTQEYYASNFLYSFHASYNDKHQIQSVNPNTYVRDLQFSTDYGLTYTTRASLVNTMTLIDIAYSNNNYIYIRDSSGIYRTFCIDKSVSNYINSACYYGNLLTNVGTNGKTSYYGTYDQFGLIGEYCLDSVSTTTSNAILFSGNYTTGNHIDLRNFASMNKYIPNYLAGFRVVSNSNPNNFSNFVLVGDAGNVPDTTISFSGGGAVSNNYYINKFPVTVKDYCDFLNSVATSSSYQSAINDIFSYVTSYINQTTVSNKYIYTPAPGASNLPISSVPYVNAARYINWLHNNKPTLIELVDNNPVTENGAFTISNGFSTINPQISNSINAKYSLPTPSQWWKAALYKGNGTNSGYWKYATQSDYAPIVSGADELRNGSITSNSFRIWQNDQFYGTQNYAHLVVSNSLF